MAPDRGRETLRTSVARRQAPVQPRRSAAVRSRAVISRSGGQKMSNPTRDARFRAK
jgi:hypothetical protein